MLVQQQRKVHRDQELVLDDQRQPAVRAAVVPASGQAAVKMMRWTPPADGIEVPAWKSCATTTKAGDVRDADYYC